MTNEERKTAILDIWHDIATDRSLQVGLRLKATEYEAKALGLIGDQPGITVLNEPDAISNRDRQRRRNRDAQKNDRTEAPVWPKTGQKR